MDGRGVRTDRFGWIRDDSHHGVFGALSAVTGVAFRAAACGQTKKPDTHLRASGFALLSDYRDLRRANMTYGSWESAFNRNLMFGLNLLLRFGLRHFQAQGAVLVAGVNVGILHVLANVEATRARAGVAFATQQRPLSSLSSCELLRCAETVR